MEFLKEILGEELFNQIKGKVDAYNGDEANKDKQIKLGNLATGEYVGKGKYDALQDALTGKETELTSANELIAQLQGKITGYETQVQQLQEQLAETKMKSAIKVALLSEKAADVDYLTYKLNEKLNEKGEKLELDENDNIKGWNDKISELKTQFPTMFESASTGDDGYKRMDDGKLPGGDGPKDSVTKEEFAKMGYKSRVELRESNPDLYERLTK